MYEQYTRTYTYKGQGNNSGTRSVKWNRFTISGDTTHIIGQIVRIEYVHAHSSINRPTRTLRGRIVLTDGTQFISNPDTYTFRGDVHRFTNIWEANFPSSDQFAIIDRIETINEAGETNNNSYGSSPLYWRANSDDPMIIRVIFVEEPPIRYSPRIEKFVVGRCNEAAQMVDDGAYVSTTLRLNYDRAQALPENTYVGIRHAGGEINITGRLGELLTAEGLNFDTSLIPGQWALGSDWVFTVVFTLGKETATAADSIGRAYAPVFISRDGNRISFNGFPRRNDGQSVEFHAPVFAYGGISGVNDYSTAETATGGKWIDGNPIYRIVIPTGGKTANVMDISVAHLNIKELISLRGLFSNGTNIFPAPAATVNTNYTIQLEMSGTNVHISTSSRTFTSGYVILEYTKN